MNVLNLRTKITVSYAALFAVVLITICGAFYQVMSTRLTAILDDRLERLSSGLWHSFSFDNVDSPFISQPVDRVTHHFVKDAVRYFQLYDGEDGHLLLRSEDPPPMAPVLSPEEALQKVKSPGFEECGTGDGELRVKNGVFGAAPHPYLLRVGIPTVWREKARRAMVSTFLILLVPGLLLSWVGGSCMARHVLRPVKQLQIAAREISFAELSRRLPLRGARDELDGLADTFNQVLARLEESVQQMKQFTASISHELRTPLAALQGETEVALMRPHSEEEYRSLLSSHLEEFQRLSDLINRLLELARADAGEIRLRNQSIDLSALVHSVGDLMEPIAANRGVSLEVTSTGQVLLLGDSQWLQRVFINLLDNAIKFTPEGHNVYLRIGVRGESAVVEVIDTGIGIAKEDIPRLFDRFYQAEPSRSKDLQGIGLGLAIAKWIVEAHDGTIQVVSEPGMGSAFTVLLPKAREQQPMLDTRAPAPMIKEI